MKNAAGMSSGDEYVVKRHTTKNEQLHAKELLALANQIKEKDARILALTKQVDDLVDENEDLTTGLQATNKLLAEALATVYTPSYISQPV